MENKAKKALLTVADLEAEFGIGQRAVPSLVAAGVLPRPVRVSPGRTSKRLWRRVDCETALLRPHAIGGAS